MNHKSGMSSIVKTVARIIVGVLILYGIYIIANGHLSPGGGFAGGANISGALILLVLAFGSDVLNLRLLKKETSVLESFAVLAFLLIGATAILTGTRVFFTNYLPRGETGDLVSAGVIPMLNITVGIEVFAALFTIFVALVIYKEETTP